MKNVFLTDGVYATVAKDDTYPVILTTGSHRLEHASNKVCLEWSALSMLVNLCIDEGVLTSKNSTAHKDIIEQICTWAISLGLSTGHADTLDDLLGELTTQIEELR